VCVYHHSFDIISCQSAQIVGRLARRLAFFLF